jgi:uncharacterized protein (UPF0262 family)/protein-tyrosine-phosphatase
MRAPSRFGWSGTDVSETTERIAAIHFDTRSVDKRSAEIEHERAIAVYDLLEQNSFAPVGHKAGPYDLHLGVIDGRLMLDIRGADGKPVIIFGLSLSPFRRVIRDYSIVCESYYAAMHAQSLTQVEAIDMGRRAVHNEGAELLVERLKGKVDIDRGTARRLFTLIYVLHTAGASTMMPSAPVPRVLFVCTRNAVRSPMAEGLLALRRGDGGRVDSAGLAAAKVDPLATSVMAEVGVDLNKHNTQSLSDVSLTDIDIVISLSSEAASAFDPPPTGLIVEHWYIDDPTEAEGNRDAKLEAYRQVRIALEKQIAARFSSEIGKMP